jgi:hypothetical protein
MPDPCPRPTRLRSLTEPFAGLRLLKFIAIIVKKMILLTPYYTDD